jgi:hypothetical protein
MVTLPAIIPRIIIRKVTASNYRRDEAELNQRFGGIYEDKKSPGEMLSPGLQFRTGSSKD